MLRKPLRILGLAGILMSMGLSWPSPPAMAFRSQPDSGIGSW